MSPDRRRAVARCGTLSSAFPTEAVWSEETPGVERAAPSDAQRALLAAVANAGGRACAPADTPAADACVARGWLTLNREGVYALTVLGAFLVAAKGH